MQTNLSCHSFRFLKVEIQRKTKADFVWFLELTALRKKYVPGWSFPLYVDHISIV